MDNQTYYISTRSPDRPGILGTLFNTISSKSGNVVHFRQNLQKSNNNDLSNEQIIADIHMLATWKIESSYLRKKAIESDIKYALADLYRREENIDIEKDIIIRVEERNAATQIPIRVHARFKIDLFDRPQIAGIIFNVFSEAKISVTESYYNLNSKPVDIDNQIVGQMIVFADVTEDTVPIQIIQVELMKIGGVFNVQSSTKTGYYSL